MRMEQQAACTERTGNKEREGKQTKQRTLKDNVHNIRAIMAKIKLPKKPLGMVIF